MNCPQCKGYKLEPSELEPGLIGCACNRCQGVLLPLMNYRYWIDHYAPEKTCATARDEEVKIDDSDQAKLCPKCDRMMSRFSIGSEQTNKLELCNGCDEAWLDRGEWGLLKTLDLEGQLPSIFTDAWQRNIRLQKQRKNMQASFKKRLGDQVFERADEFKTWLDRQPDRGDIMQYLSIKTQ